MHIKAILILQDGTIFYGKNDGIKGTIFGEIVFNTSMTGYQEILTDPSYSNQFIVFTYPHIGNIGINNFSSESKKIHVKGIIAKNLSKIASHYTSQKTILKYLKENKIISITDIDTRKLTKIIRTSGTQYGCITTDINISSKKILKKISEYSNFPKKNIILKKSTKKKYIWTTKKSSSPFNYLNRFHIPYKKKNLFHVVVYDFGIKRNILEILSKKNCIITIVPAETKIKKILELKPSGILLSNGPGDPRLCAFTVQQIKKLLFCNIPIFGICLGHQILALAENAKIITMKFGHHGSNHPVKSLSNNRIFITSQNHNYTIDPLSLNKNIKITHISLFDNTIQGISLKNSLAFSFQGHPEAFPGPHDIQILFDKFIKIMSKKEKKCLKDLI
ncbi:glutamine-hydrolyzing carbamoyl-phosphate synthase small subunit [Buchnera aphidicola]|uniref:Carbamoyl phosphate synthase small chain n=1 Tax=Buchnera aphidicola subsp. Tuberolachnus salignus TaxID=98804 RepID=A0A160SYI6_BUCTT|nr:glutamine-hydrolyzing carbamoyl-phosphate synthase small subunit [Buchnera aphidicola]CUR53081.1 Carbamoyl-phosphate synthase small chain [Buchnera aphidicola (Tuberolachnus salignus)]